MLFLFPIDTNLWYVPAIAFLYIIFYLVMKWGRNYRWYFIGGTVVLYTVIYTIGFDKSEFFVEPTIWFRLMYGFIAMMLGSLLRDRMEQGKKMLFKEALLLIGACLCIMGFLATKLLMSRIEIIMEMQFMTQVLSVAFAWFAVQWGVVTEKKAKIFIKTRLGKIVAIVSSCSLEIYLIQFPIINVLKELLFPVNFVLICICIVIAGYAVHLICNVIIKQLTKIMCHK